MTKWLISKSRSQRRWEVVSFTGRRRRESAGIVDLLAIRKNHGETVSPHRRGDLFEMILIQVKGGNPTWPSASDIARLRAVQSYYHARDVLLAEWRKGEALHLHSLRSGTEVADGTDAWVKLNGAQLKELFR